MARTMTILAFIAAFLTGVFVTSFMSLYNLTSTAFIGAEWSGSNLDMSSFVKDASNSVRGSAIQIKDAMNDERNKMLMKEIADLQKTIENLKKSSGTSSQSITDEASDKSTYTTEANNKQTGMCSLLPQPTPTALSMWSSHLPHILNASQHPEDRDFIYREFTSLLLHYMTPDRMQRGVKTLPLDWTPVERGLDVMYKRWKFIQEEVDSYRSKNNIPAADAVPPNILEDIHKNPKIPRPLNVVVMGGSVTMGVVCHINPVTKTGISRRNCAWPGRMTPFFSKLLDGYELVQFHTVAMGGTNTESGITMWDYSLLPGDTPYPDVVINAYAVSIKICATVCKLVLNVSSCETVASLRLMICTTTQFKVLWLKILRWNAVSLS
jgi:hypothetical protein